MSGGAGVALASRWSGGHGAFHAIRRIMVPRLGEAGWAGGVKMELACIAKDTLARIAHATLFARAVWSRSRRGQSATDVGRDGACTSVTPFVATTCGASWPVATP